MAATLVVALTRSDCKQQQQQQFCFKCLLVACRMLMCPWGSSLLLGNANGGIRRLQIGSDDPLEHKPKLVEVSGQQHVVTPGQQHVMTPGQQSSSPSNSDVAMLTSNSSYDVLGHKPKLVEVSGQQHVVTPGQQMTAEDFAKQQQ
jgi:hypothetical protein